jgi:type II secretory pathway pseudopilin PulG
LKIWHLTDVEFFDKVKNSESKEKKMKKQNKKHESGRSMIEMVGVLAVMGLITAAAFVLITSAMRSQKLSRADDDISALAAGVRLLYNNSPDFSNLTAAQSANTLKALGFDKVKPAYGSSDTYTVKVDSSDSSKFVISFDAGDASTCSALAARTWGNGGTAACSTGGNNATGATASTLEITFDDGKGE